MIVYPMYSVVGMIVGYFVANYGFRHRWGIARSVAVTVAIGLPIAVLIEMCLWIGAN